MPQDWRTLVCWKRSAGAAFGLICLGRDLKALEEHTAEALDAPPLKRDFGDDPYPPNLRRGAFYLLIEHFDSRRCRWNSVGYWQSWNDSPNARPVALLIADDEELPPLGPVRVWQQPDRRTTALTDPNAACKAAW